MSGITKLVDQDYLCEMLGVSREVIRALRKSGTLKPIRINNRVFRYDPEEVAKLQKLWKEARDIWDGK